MNDPEQAEQENHDLENSLRPWIDGAVRNRCEDDHGNQTIKDRAFNQRQRARALLRLCLGVGRRGLNE